jgi:NADH-quinone oxidoreductase subunit N
VSDSFWPTSAELLRLSPEIVLTLAGTAIMTAEPVTADENKSRFAWWAFFALIAAIALSIIAHGNPGPAFSNMIVVDGFATFFRVLVFSVGLLTILLSLSYLDREKLQQGEYYALLLFSIVGQGILATANELIMVFIGIEISSIATYVLAGYMREDRRSGEAAIKYFLLGSFATAFLLYGIAWIYGLTGSTSLETIRTALASSNFATSESLVGLAAALMAVGFAFKVAAAPFQVWAPDVYQGAPAPVAAFMSVGPKAAAFAVFLRVFRTAFEPIGDRWEPIIWVVALATMCIGNFAALRQTNIKRLLAYSSIATAGYILVAITARSANGEQAVMFYLASYVLMTIGAFAIITYFSRQGERFLEINDLSGLAARQPAVAGLFTLFALSMIGVPLTAGFFAKFYVFRAALDSDLVWLTVFGLLNSALAAYYYLQILVVMYMREPGSATENLEPMPGTIQLAAWVSAVGTLLLGVFPNLLLRLTGAWTLSGK